MNDLIFDAFILLRPHWLWLIPAAYVVYWLTKKLLQQDVFWNQQLSPQIAKILLVQKGKAKHWPAWVLALFWVLSCIALAGPSWNKIELPVAKSKEALFFIVDMSLSMLAQDVKPSRKDLARFSIIDVLRQINDGQAALLVYAGSGHVVTPLTDDSNTIINQLNALSPTIMPKLGSNSTTAFEKIETMLKSSNTKGKILWITDEASQEDIAKAQTIAKQHDLKLILLPIGTSEGAPVPVPSGFLTDGSGKTIIAKVPFEHMKNIAINEGVDYIPISQLSSALIEQLVTNTGVFAQPTEEDSPKSDILVDSGFWILPMLLALILLFFRRGWILLVVLMVVPQPSYAINLTELFNRPDQIGHKAFESNDFPRAIRHFKDPNWQASTLYRLKEYEIAANLWASQEQWYNAGNAFALANDYKKAIASYQYALKENPDHADAKYNLELLLKQQQSGQSQDQEKGEPSDEDQQEDSSGGQDQEQEESEDNGGAKDSEEASEEENEEDLSEEEKAEQEALDEEAKQKALEEAKTREAQQELQQWLKKIPNDPSLLLKRKFEHQYNQLRQQNAVGSDDGKSW